MTRRRPETRAPGDRIVELAEAGELTDYQPETLRKKAAAGAPDAPPLFKYRGRWCAWTSDLERWVDEQQTPAGGISRAS